MPDLVSSIRERYLKTLDTISAAARKSLIASATRAPSNAINATPTALARINHVTARKRA
ncbi:MAG: hypothetical protein HYR93_06205, partial [Chloroflexi bacterium]|nr:hypothetical protein [Chloroflexota bacterium]